MSSEPQTSDVPRHQRFRNVMDAAAGSANPQYDGYGRFWNLPLSDLRDVTIYSIPMMRGAVPGLVTGLRGLYPFDGSQYPRLPWGGSPVAESDVRFIAAWIADGCPGESEDVAAPAAQDAAAVHALATGAAAHAAFAGPVNALAGPGRLRQRKNVNFLTADELGRLRTAIAKMKSLDTFTSDERSFAYWARIHAEQCQHGWEEFLTWHRLYLYFFELQLQDIDPTVTLPYWDWAADAANLALSIADMGNATNDNGIVPEAYRCWIDDAAVQRLADGGDVPAETLAKLRTMVGAPAENSGARFFQKAGITYGADPASKAIRAQLELVNPLFDWNRWPGGNGNLIFEAYPTKTDETSILGLTSFFAFGSGPMDDQYFGALENIHNLIHNFSGGANPYANLPGEPATGDMVNAGVTAFDPLFWAHHANVDRIWSVWQGLNPNAGPDNPATVLPPWNMTVADSADIAKLGYEYAVDSLTFPTDNDVPLQQFRSADVAIHPDVLTAYRRAEIRLHAVQHVTRAGFYVRAFLNSPGATIDTPTRGNDHYVGQFSMFTGLCIGGPGHCAVPKPRSRHFDRRPPPHKLPSSVRFDATDAVRALSAAGAPSFQVNLIVLNTDGTPADDALLIDGVSLNFIA
jgi:tyrosinase